MSQGRQTPNSSGSKAAGEGQHLRYKPKHPFLAGGITGAIEICITYPLEYAKCQLQLSQPGHSSGAKSSVSGSLLGVFRDTMRNRGVVGLYSGLPPWYAFMFVHV